MSTGPLTASHSTPPAPRHPRGMGIAERSYDAGWRAACAALMFAAVRLGVPVEILQKLQAIADAGPERKEQA